MSSQLKPVHSREGEIGLTRFFGGIKEGVCVQMSPRWVWGTFTTLNKRQALSLALALIEFAKDKREEVPE